MVPPTEPDQLQLELVQFASCLPYIAEQGEWFDMSCKERHRICGHTRACPLSRCEICPRLQCYSGSVLWPGHWCIGKNTWWSVPRLLAISRCRSVQRFQRVSYTWSKFFIHSVSCVVASCTSEMSSMVCAWASRSLQRALSLVRCFRSRFIRWLLSLPYCLECILMHIFNSSHLLVVSSRAVFLVQFAIISSNMSRCILSFKNWVSIHGPGPVDWVCGGWYSAVRRSWSDHSFGTWSLVIRRKAVAIVGLEKT
jgi:hypothetical protein